MRIYIVKYQVSVFLPILVPTLFHISKLTADRYFFFNLSQSFVRFEYMYIEWKIISNYVSSTFVIIVNDTLSVPIRYAINKTVCFVAKSRIIWYNLMLCLVRFFL